MNYQLHFWVLIFLYVIKIKKSTKKYKKSTQKYVKKAKNSSKKKTKKSAMVLLPPLPQICYTLFLTAKVSSSTSYHLGLSVCVCVYKVEIIFLKVHRLTLISHTVI